MNEKGGSEPTTNTPSESAESTRPSPVMDVIARRPAESGPMARTEIAPPPDVLAQIQPAETPHDPPKQPISDMVKSNADSKSTTGDVKQAPPDEEASKPSSEHKTGKRKAPKEDKPKPIKQAKHSSGVGPAITATVIIVLVLSALTVYAYLQSKK